MMILCRLHSYVEHVNYVNYGNSNDDDNR